MATSPTLNPGPGPGPDSGAAPGADARRGLLEALADALQDGLAVVAADGRVVDVSPTLARLLGVGRAALVGRPAAELVHPGDRVRAVARLRGVVRRPRAEAVRLECRLARADGSWLPVEATAAGRGVDPAFGGLVLVVRDVTRRVRAERRLRESELRLQATLRNADVGVWEWDAAHDRLTWLNDWHVRHGVRPCDGDGHVRQLLEILDPEHAPRIYAAFEAHAAGVTDRYEVEYRVRDRDGRWLWLAMRARIVERTADGAPLRMLGAAFAVDERKRLEHELERRQRQLEAAAAAVPAWLVLTDLEQRIEFANRPVLGVPPERLVGRRVADCVDAAEAERFARHHRACVERREPTQYRSVLDGGRRVLENRLAPVISHGAVVGVASSTTEATDRLALERAVLEIGNRERRRFGSDLHDGLGQEVTGIALTLKSLLLRAEAEGSPLVAGLREVLQHANGAIDTARRMARGVSPVAREQGGLQRALADLARPGAGGAAAVRCEVSAALPDDLEPLVADHLYRIAQEAVTNALRHAAATRVTVALETTDAGLRLAVDDDGTGVDPVAELGPGLGLKIMRYRAEQIGGTLVIGPAPGGGTRVECRCPATV